MNWPLRPSFPGENIREINTLLCVLMVLLCAGIIALGVFPRLVDLPSSFSLSVGMGLGMMALLLGALGVVFQRKNPAYKEYLQWILWIPALVTVIMIASLVLI